MLEEEVEGLELPPQLSLYPQETVWKDHQTNSNYNTWSDSIPSSSYIGESATNPLVDNSGWQMHEIWFHNLYVLFV